MQAIQSFQYQLHPLHLLQQLEHFLEENINTFKFFECINTLMHKYIAI
jgi:hypothetical protein